MKGENLYEREIRRERALFDLVDANIVTLMERVCGLTDLTPFAHETVKRHLEYIRREISAHKP